MMNYFPKFIEGDQYENHKCPSGTHQCSPAHPLQNRSAQCQQCGRRYRGNPHRLRRGRLRRSPSHRRHHRRYHRRDHRRHSGSHCQNHHRPGCGRAGAAAPVGAEMYRWQFQRQGRRGHGTVGFVRTAVQGPRLQASGRRPEADRHRYHHLRQRPGHHGQRLPESRRPWLRLPENEGGRESGAGRCPAQRRAQRRGQRHRHPHRRQSGVDAQAGREDFKPDAGAWAGHRACGAARKRP